MWGSIIGFIGKKAVELLGPKLAAALVSSKAKMVLIIITVISVAGAAGGFWWHYTSLKKNYEECLKEKGQYEVALKTTKESFKAYRTSVTAQLEQMKQQMNLLRQKYQESEERANELGKLLAKHDFAYLAYRKPGLIERRVNDATARMFSDLEKASRDFARRGKPSESSSNVPSP